MSDTANPATNVVAKKREDSTDELDSRGMRRAALLLLTVLVVVGTCFSPRVFLALDFLVVGVVAYHFYGRSLRA
jgi:hypothetical protein